MMHIMYLESSGVATVASRVVKKVRAGVSFHLLLSSLIIMYVVMIGTSLSEPYTSESVVLV